MNDLLKKKVFLIFLKFFKNKSILLIGENQLFLTYLESILFFASEQSDELKKLFFFTVDS